MIKLKFLFWFFLKIGVVLISFANNFFSPENLRQFFSLIYFVQTIFLTVFDTPPPLPVKNNGPSLTEMIINLDEFNNSDNLEDGHPSNTLFTYHVNDDKDFTRFEPQTPQYRKLKNGKFTSLTLRITDQASNVITDGPQVTVVLHIKYNPL